MSENKPLTKTSQTMKKIRQNAMEKIEKGTFFKEGDLPNCSNRWMII